MLSHQVLCTKKQLAMKDHPCHCRYIHRVLRTKKQSDTTDRAQEDPTRSHPAPTKMLSATTDQVQWETTNFRQIIRNKLVQLEGRMGFHRVLLLRKRLVMNDRAFHADKQVLP